MNDIFQSATDPLDIWQKLLTDGAVQVTSFEHFLFVAEFLAFEIEQPIHLNLCLTTQKLFLFFIMEGGKSLLLHQGIVIANTIKGTCAFSCLRPDCYQYQLPKGRHKLLYFIPKPEWLQHDTKVRPRLRKFMEKAGSGVHAFYQMPRIRINPDILRQVLKLERLYQEKSGDIEAGALKIFNKLMALYLAMLPAGDHQVLFVTQQEQVEEIEAYILQYYKQPTLVSIQSLCNEFGLSESKLFRVFKEKTGLTVHAYVLKQKMDLAWSLVTYQDATFKNIAEQLGFKNQYQFSVAFKKYFNCSPQKLRIEKKGL